MNRPVVISLCDLTGNFTQPWSEAGHDVILVDPQHGVDSVVTLENGATLTLLAKTISEAMPALTEVCATRNVVFVAGFPPCTDLAVSGARHFQRKMTDATWEHYKGPTMFEDAVAVALQCEAVGVMAGSPWFAENPVSRLSTLWRKPDHKFNPHDFTMFERGDNYSKKTCLWTGGGFIMPQRNTHPDFDAIHVNGELVRAAVKPDDRIHKAPPGPGRMNFRSATPMGFARAVFEANSLKVAA